MMKQFTLIWVYDSNIKLVAMKSFITFELLLDFKNEYFKENKKLNQVDKDGYVWFVKEN